MDFIVIILFVLIIVGMGLFLKLHDTGTWSVNTYAGISLIIFYGITPLLFITQYMIGKTKSVYAYDFQGTSIWIEMIAIIIIGLISYTTSYSLTYTFPQKRYYLAPKTLGNKSWIYYIAMGLLLLSIISHYIYVSGFGSYHNAIAQADLVRSQYFKEINPDSSFTFFKRFIPLSIIYLLSFRDIRSSNRIIDFLFLGVALANLLMYYFLLENSRQSLFQFVLLFFMAISIQRGKYNLMIFVAFAIVLILFMGALDAFFTSRDASVIRMDEDPLDSFVQQFIFPYHSLQKASSPEAPTTFFYDFWDGLFGSVLPSSWGGNNAITGYNSESLGLARGTVPPGILAQGYYSLGISGVVLTMAFTGCFFAKIDLFFRTLNNSSSYFYAYVILSSFTWIRTGIPKYYFYSVIILCIFLSLKLGYEKKITHQVR